MRLSAILEATDQRPQTKIRRSLFLDGLMGVLGAFMIVDMNPPVSGLILGVPVEVFAPLIP